MHYFQTFCDGLERLHVGNVQYFLTEAGKSRYADVISPDQYMYLCRRVFHSSQIVRGYILRNMTQRMDWVNTRPFDEFAEGIMVKSKRQDKDTRSWIEKYAAKHYPEPFEVVDTGCDNRGLIIIEPTKNMKNLDYLLKSNSLKWEKFLDHEHDPSHKKATYKLSKLDVVSRVNGALLTLHPNFYTLMTSETVDKLLSLPVDKKRERWEVGHKPSVQLLSDASSSELKKEGAVSFEDYLTKHYYQ